MEPTKLQAKALGKVQSRRIKLKDGSKTTVHIACFDKRKVTPKVVRFQKALRLKDWCNHQGVDHAITGGFSLHHTDVLLGDLWIDGGQHQTDRFAEPWHEHRGSIHICEKGSVRLAPRNELPAEPLGDLLMAGPLLVKNGQSLIKNDDPEGFFSAHYQFDDPISIGRFPRSAIAASRDHIWMMVCEGRSDGEAGLTFREMADIFIDEGAETALNLDGGRSSSLIFKGQMINRPRSNFEVYPDGFPIRNAIVLLPRKS